MGILPRHQTTYTYSARNILAGLSHRPQCFVLGLPKIVNFPDQHEGIALARGMKSEQKSALDHFHSNRR
jgi:hypothetical protein